MSHCMLTVYLQNVSKDIPKYNLKVQKCSGK